MTPNLTDAGKNLLLRALIGDTINFTKMQLGNGPTQSITDATGLVNSLMEVEFSKIDIGEEYVTLTASFSNSEVTSGFHITEIGIFAQDPDDNSKEILYALGNEDESMADYVPDNASRVFEIELAALVFIGNAENVAAAINSSLVYVSNEEFKKHLNNENNPHKVTKSDVGLGDVPNVSTNDQTPTYEDSKKLETLTSGEKLSTTLSKIKCAISAFINHIAETTKNPHKIKASDIGAATTSHTHSTNDINSGILGVQRGGTGGNTPEKARESLEITPENIGAMPYYIHDMSLDLDSDELKTYGVHIFHAEPLNRPCSNWGTLIVDSLAGTPYQIFIPDGDDSTIFKRVIGNTCWRCFGEKLRHNLTFEDSGHIVLNNKTSDDGYYALEKARSIDNTEYLLTMGIATNGASVLENYKAGKLVGRIELDDERLRLKKKDNTFCEFLHTGNSELAQLRADIDYIAVVTEVEL